MRKQVKNFRKNLTAHLKTFADTRYTNRLLDTGAAKTFELKFLADNVYCNRGSTGNFWQNDQLLRKND